MLNDDTRSRLLQQYPILRDLPAAELETVLAAASVMQLPAGTILFDEN